MDVYEITRVDEEVIEAFTRLVPQLSTTARIPSVEELEDMVNSKASIVLGARAADGKIAGALTLIVFRVPTGIRSFIEDVVVDTAYRGQGIGEALTRAAIARARQEGAKTVDLSSRPAREAANRLYQRTGFERRETNMYRYKL